jgi:hypothetical protein
MMATVHHVIVRAGRTKYQAARFLLNRVYNVHKKSDATKCYLFVIMIHNLMKFKTECRYTLRLWVGEVLHVDHL